MPQISVTKVVDAPLDQVWSIVADFGGIYRFHPRVERSPIVNGQASGVGAQRVCHFYDGSHIKEEVTGLEEGRSIEVAIIEGSLPLNDAKGTISVESVGTTSTRVLFEIDYTPKYGLVGKLMNAVMIRRQFGKIIAQVLDGLEVHAKTGAVVGQNGEAVAAPASA